MDEQYPPPGSPLRLDPAPSGVPMPGPPLARPCMVTIAAGLMFVLAGLLVVETVANAAARWYALDSVPEPDQEWAPGVMVMFVAVNACVNLGVMIALAVLAVLNRRGNAVSRILTWLLCGFIFLWASYSGMMAAITFGSNFGSPLVVPTWLISINVGAAGLMLLIAIAIVAALARPTSNAYFRRKPAALPR